MSRWERKLVKFRFVGRFSKALTLVLRAPYATGCVITRSFAFTFFLLLASASTPT